MANAPLPSFERFQRVDPGPIVEDSSSDGDIEMTTDEAPGRLIIAIDFGTTFSSVAYARLNEATQGTTLSLMDVKCISRYPEDRPGHHISFAWEYREDVPTELWYSPRPSPKQRRAGGTEIRPSGDGPENGHSTESDSSSDSSQSEDENENEVENEGEQREEERAKPDTLFWGFGVQKQLKMIDIPKDGTKRIARFKLMLDEKNEHTDHIRAEIGAIVKNLKRSKLIKKDTDIISDYLTQLFTHTRNELRNMDDFNDNLPIEFVLCIPAVWPSKACRIMQTAMATAAQRSGLGSLQSDSLSNLFIVSEPEAAAAWVLAENNNDIFVSSLSRPLVDILV